MTVLSLFYLVWFLPNSEIWRGENNICTQHKQQKASPSSTEEQVNTDFAPATDILLMPQMTYSMYFIFTETFYTQTLFSIHMTPLATTNHHIQKHM